MIDSINFLVHVDSCLVPVVQKLDSAIQCISITITNCVIDWVVIYPVDSAIHLLNKWGPIFRIFRLKACFFFSYHHYRHLFK